jgi:hypothetical protein
MSEADLTVGVYPSEWSVADVLSHLGSGAVITHRRLEDALAGRKTPDDFALGVWDEWNAKGPLAQRADAQNRRPEPAVLSVWLSAHGRRPAKHFPARVVVPGVYRDAGEDLADRSRPARSQDADLTGHVPYRRLGTRRGRRRQ